MQVTLPGGWVQQTDAAVCTPEADGAKAITLLGGLPNNFLVLVGSGGPGCGRIWARDVDYTVANGVITFTTVMPYTCRLTLIDPTTGETLWVYCPRRGQIYPES